MDSRIQSSRCLLSAVGPDLRKEFSKSLRKTGTLIAKDAAGRAPLGKTGDLRAGYRVYVRSLKTTTRVRVGNDTPHSNILEFAGSKSQGNTQQGTNLIAGLTRKYGKTGRFLWAAFDRLEPEIQRMVDEARQSAEAGLQKRLNGVDS